MSVKVGVRVRPFNHKQKNHKQPLCVDMHANITRIFTPQDSGVAHREFTYDHSFWSHDQFAVAQDGYYMPQTDKYADQSRVFEKVGEWMLQSVFEGYHCCLFNYGQTGAGKSYSMMGCSSNKGIVPTFCEQMFKIISNSHNPAKDYEVRISMLEIYNQQIGDLLSPEVMSSKCNIRQNKAQGVYVEGLTKCAVNSLEQIQSAIEKGFKNQSIGITMMGKPSSRIITIISIQLKQITQQNGQLREKLANIQFVELAGSQKISKTGQSSAVITEITKLTGSLNTFRHIVDRLSENAAGKKNFIPYRNSRLTRLVQHALGGNCKTYILCALAPSLQNYQQTLATLRFAERARRMCNCPVINERQISMGQYKQEMNGMKSENIHKMIAEQKIEVCENGHNHQNIVDEKEQQLFALKKLLEQYEQELHKQPPHININQIQASIKQTQAMVVLKEQQLMMLTKQLH